MRSLRHLKIAWPPFPHIKSFLSPHFSGESLTLFLPLSVRYLSLSIVHSCPFLFTCRMSSPFLATESKVICFRESNGRYSTSSWLFNRSSGCGGWCVGALYEWGRPGWLSAVSNGFLYGSGQPWSLFPLGTIRVLSSVSPAFYSIEALSLFFNLSFATQTIVFIENLRNRSRKASKCKHSDRQMDLIKTPVWVWVSVRTQFCAVKHSNWRHFSALRHTMVEEAQSHPCFLFHLPSWLLSLCPSCPNSWLTAPFHVSTRSSSFMSYRAY